MIEDLMDAHGLPCYRVTASDGRQRWCEDQWQAVLHLERMEADVKKCDSGEVES